jgi:hypothetical protein
MKKIFLVTALIAAFTISKQANAQQGFSVSVKATPQFSFLQNKDDRDNNSLQQKATFNANFGVGAGYNFTSKYGVGIDALYSLQGQRYKINGIETNQRVDYIKIPVYFSYTANPSKPVSFIGKIGPQISILTDSKLTDKNGHTLKSDTKDLYKNVTFGGMAAVGVQFKLDKNLFLTTMARFDYDFMNAEDHSNAYYQQVRAKTYNMTTGLEVGLKYVL